MMTSEVAPNWDELAGRRIQIWKGGSLIRTGYVDDVAPAADALWLAGHGADRRAMYEKAEGYTAKPVKEALWTS